MLLDTNFLFFVTCSDGLQATSRKGRQSPEDEARDTAVNSWTSFTLQVRAPCQTCLRATTPALFSDSISYALAPPETLGTS